MFINTKETSMNTIRNKLALAMGVALMASTPMAFGTPAHAASRDADLVKTPCVTIKWSKDHDLLVGETAQVKVKVAKPCKAAKVTLSRDGVKLISVKVSHKDGFVYDTTALVDSSATFTVSVATKGNDKFKSAVTVSRNTYDWIKPRVA